MKKICIISAILTMVLAGCAKELQTNQNASSSDKIAGPQTISAGFDETKVAMSDDDKSVSYTWKTGDKILFVNLSDTSTVVYTLSSGVGESSATFTKSSGNFTSSNTYVCCHPGSAVNVSSAGEFVDDDGKSILKGQNPAQLEDYMVFAGYSSGSSKAYSFDGESIPTSFGFEAPFTMLKVSVSNTSSAAVTPNGIKVDGGQGSNYFLGTLKVDATSGIAASGAMDYLQMTISGGSKIAASGTGAYSFMCVQNPSRTFSGLKVSIFY